MVKSRHIFLLLIIGVTAPIKNYAQAIDIWQVIRPTGSIQNYYILKTNSELSKSIFSSYSINELRGFERGYFNTYNPPAIEGPGTPKSAIFCRFENTLWKTLDIGVRLRVENPPKDY